MKRATITETKNRLSALIDAVKEGETILILDRGRPVAKLVPVLDREADDDARLAALEKAGLVRRATRPAPHKLPPSIKLPPGVSVLEALLEERGRRPPIST